MNVEHVILRERKKRGKRLGRHIEHDARSFAFASGTGAGPLFSVQWERHCPPFDQGELGSCTGNALAGALMTGPLYVPGRELVEADAVKIYSLATSIDNVPGRWPPTDTGSSGLAVCKAAKRMGLLSVYHHAFSLQAALQALTHGPIIIGINWYEGFDRPVGSDAELVISGAIRGGHELVVDGMDVDAGIIKITNSWGLSYGNNGLVIMSFGTLAKLLKQRGDAVVPVR